MKLEYKNYEELENIFGDDTTVCGEVTECSDTDYLCDACMSVADSNVPVYSYELLDNARELEEYVDEAISQGLCEGVDTLLKFLEIGAYEYYRQLLDDNLDTIALNIAIEVINDEYNSDQIELVDYDDLEAEFESTDSDDTIDMIKDKAREFMNNLIEEAEEEEEEEEDEEEEEE